jgi:hypothetical protein
MKTNAPPKPDVWITADAYVNPPSVVITIHGKTAEIELTPLMALHVAAALLDAYQHVPDDLVDHNAKIILDVYTPRVQA